MLCYNGPIVFINSFLMLLFLLYYFLEDKHYSFYL